jgi:hypothetical protein
MDQLKSKNEMGKKSVRYSNSCEIEHCNLVLKEIDAQRNAIINTFPLCYIIEKKRYFCPINPGIF